MGGSVGVTPSHDVPTAAATPAPAAHPGHQFQAGQLHAFPHDGRPHPFRGRAEREADAKIPRAAPHVEGGNGVQAEGRDQKRQHGKRCQHARHAAFQLRDEGQAARHRFARNNRDGRVDLGDGFAGGLDGLGEGAAVANHQRRIDGRIAVILLLGHEHVSRLRIVRGSVEERVRRDADDLGGFAPCHRQRSSDG